jgi:hypothetical protein
MKSVVSHKLQIRNGLKYKPRVANRAWATLTKFFTHVTGVFHVKLGRLCAKRVKLLVLT